MKKLLLDTNGYSALLKGDTAVLDALARADRTYMSVFVLGELHAGFRGGSRFNQNLGRLDAFLRKPSVRVLQATRETAEVFGTVKDSLRRAGTPLPINDVWIAAHCLESGAELFTFDRHFRAIAGLRLWENP